MGEGGSLCLIAQPTNKQTNHPSIHLSTPRCARLSPRGSVIVTWSIKFVSEIVRGGRVFCRCCRSSSAAAASPPPQFPDLALVAIVVRSLSKYRVLSGVVWPAAQIEWIFIRLETPSLWAAVRGSKVDRQLLHSGNQCHFGWHTKTNRKTRQSDQMITRVIKHLLKVEEFLCTRDRQGRETAALQIYMKLWFVWTLRVNIKGTFNWTTQQQLC